jgi:hypothetical protein
MYLGHNLHRFPGVILTRLAVGGLSQWYQHTVVLILLLGLALWFALSKVVSCRWGPITLCGPVLPLLWACS